MSANVDPTLPVAPSAIDRDNPWPGLGSYDESMHAFFFGRDFEVGELLRLVRRDAVALFYGQSGLGKSSLLQAGLFPRLRAADLLPVHIRLRFGAEYPHPVEQILQEVGAAARRNGGEAPPGTPGCSLYEYFYDAQHEFWSARNRVLTPVVVFDQFEEIFTLGQRDASASAHRAALLTELADLAARRAPDALVARFEHEPELAERFGAERTRCRLLFSLREDFLPELGSLRDHLPTLASGGLRLQRLRGDQARDVLERPGSHLLEEGTAERIIRFVAAERGSDSAHELSELEVEPALLNVVARELNNRRQARGLSRISADVVQGARNEILADFYDRAFAGIDPHVRAFVEDQLLTTTGYRDSVAVEDAEASYRVSRDVLSTLVDRRLLRIDERFQMQRVELTHDLLAGVAKASRDSRREREAAEAERRRAEEAKRVAEQAVAEAQAKLRHTRTRALIGSAMALLALGIGGLLYLNHRQGEEARRLDLERRRAVEAGQAADLARQEAKANLERANEAMAGSRMAQAEAALAQGAFDQAQLWLRLGQDKALFSEKALTWFSAALNQPRILQLEAVIRSDTDTATVDFVPGGRLLTLTRSGAVRMLAPAAGDVEGGTMRSAPLSGDLGGVADATSLDVLWGDPTLVAVGTRSHGVQLFALHDGTLVRTLRETAADSAAGQDASSAGEAKSGATAAQTAPEDASAIQVRFSNDGRSLAAISATGRITVWHLGDSAAWIPSADPADSGEIARYVHQLGTAETPARASGPVELTWATDGSLLVSDAEAIEWLERPGPEWAEHGAIERLGVGGLRSTVLPSGKGRLSEWFAANSVEGRIYWLRLPAEAAPGSNASEARTSEATADTVHNLVSLPGSDVIFGAMRNGTIAAFRTVFRNSQGSLRLLQSVAAPRARHIALRARPDGRYLAATTDDGTTCLYRVVLPAVLGTMPDAPLGLTRDADGSWLHLDAHGALRREDGSPAGASVPALPDGGQVIATHLAGSALDQALALVTLHDSGGGADTPAQYAVVRLATGERLWAAPISEAGRGTPTVAGFSRDGSRVAVSAPGGHIRLLTTSDGQAAGPDLSFVGEAQRIAWSGNGQRLAVASDLQEIFVFDLGQPQNPAVTLHARHSQIQGFALDHPGHTLTYSTADARLVLERFAPTERRLSLMTPLVAETPLLVLDDADGTRPARIVAQVRDKTETFSGALPPLDDSAWLTFQTVQGYDTASAQVTGSQVSHLQPDWLEDASSLSAESLLRDMYAWLDRTAATFSTPHADGFDERLAGLVESGETLAKHMAALGRAQPAFAALGERLQRATGDVVAFSEELAPDLSPLERWPIVSFQRTRQPDSDAAQEFAVKSGFNAVLEHMRSDDAAPETSAQRAEYQTIVRLAAKSGRIETALGDARATLRPRLFDPAEWRSLILETPGEILLDREANTLATERDLDASSEFYAELERRFPTALTYPIRRANNLRKAGRVDEALALFEHVAQEARSQGNGEVEAEALVYRAWTYQTIDGRLDDARADMLAAARLADHDSWTLRNVVAFILEHGPAEAGITPAANLVAVDNSASNLLLQGRVLLANNDAAGARTALAPLGESPELAERLKAVDLLRETGSYANHVLATEWAQSAFDQASDRDTRESALRVLGPLALATHKYVPAINALDELLKYGPDLDDQAVIHAYLGRLHLYLRNFDSAKRELDLSFRLLANPAPRFRRDRAFLLEWSGDNAGAMAEFRKAAQDGDETDAWELVRASARLEKPAALKAQIDAALNRFPEDPMLRIARAEWLLKSQPDAARSDLESLDDGSTSRSAVMAAALLGRGLAAAQRHAGSMDDPTPEDLILQAGVRALASAQTLDPNDHFLALAFIAEAMDRGYRGDLPLRTEFGMGPLNDDPAFQIAIRALAAPVSAKDSWFDAARFHAATAALTENADLKAGLLAHAVDVLKRGIAAGVFTSDDVRATPDLAEFVTQF